MTHRILLGLCAGLLLAATSTHADVSPLQFDDTIPPTVPAGDTAFPTTIPCGKSLVIPVAASNPNGGTLVYSATSSNPAIMVRVRTGNPVLRLGISHDPALTGTDIAVSGTLDLMLFRDFTPITAGFIGGLAQNKFYDGVTFHRIAPGFMAQGGDPGNGPNGLGSGGPGFTFPNEFKLPLIFTGKGQFAMANSGYKLGFGSNGSQFFITYAPTRWLDFMHTNFGQLLRGWDTLYQMSLVENVNNAPLDPDEGTPDPVTGAPDPVKSLNTRPLSPMTISSANLVKTNDAVLYLSAISTGSANITVTISDPVSNAAPVSRSFAVTSTVDQTNDPVILVPPSDTIAPAKGKATVVLQTQDLEFNRPIFNAQFVSGTNGLVSFGGLLGNKLTISGTPSTFTGPLDLWVAAAGADASSWTGQGLVSVRIGGKAIIPQPATVTVRTGTTTIVAGGFLDKDSKATSAKYSATINWGDGVISTGSDAIVSKVGSSAKFQVSGTHAYANPGIYPLYVEVNATQGGSIEPLTKMYGTANVAAGDLLANGLALSSNGGKISNKPVATFQDASPVASGSYKAIIDWGDGVTSSGTVAKLSGTTSFKVLGSHRYTDSCSYSVNVRISKLNETVDAWSTAAVKVPAPSFLPPFPQAHLAAVPINPLFQLTGTTSSDYVVQTGTISVVNVGNKKSPAGTMRFYLGTNGSNYTPQLTYDRINPLVVTLPALNPGAKTNIVLTNSRPLFWTVGTGANYKSNDKTVYFVFDFADPLAQLEPGTMYDLYTPYFQQ